MFRLPLRNRGTTSCRDCLSWRGVCVIMLYRFPELCVLRGLVWLASMCVGATPTYAIPIDGLTVAWSVSCNDQSVCSGMARSDGAVGRYTGITITKSAGGKAELEVDRKGAGRFYFNSEDTSPVSLHFSWDGDPHPEQLSGAGLNCLDITRQGAYALVISGVRIKASCDDGVFNAMCPEVSIESRMYDARDPTGQRFSSSTIHRTLHQKTNVTVPFSNFITAGPRGRADFSCVGAVTMTVRFDGFSSGELEFGPIYTNGSEGLTPLPTATPMPTDTPQPATPTPTPQATSSIIATAEAVPLAEHSAAAAREVTNKSDEGAVIRAPTAVPVQEISPAPTTRPAGAEKQRLSEEVVYGQVVSATE